MQMIAEVYGILRDAVGLKAQEMADIFADWNGRDLQSYLIEISALVLAERDPDTGEALVDQIVDEAGQKGTGRWSVIEAQKLGIGATTLEAAVSARGISSRRQERAEAAGIFANVTTARAEFHADHEGLAELESALVTAKIIAYARATRRWPRRAANSIGTCRSGRSRASGGRAASSARASSTTSPAPTRRGTSSTSCRRRASRPASRRARRRCGASWPRRRWRASRFRRSRPRSPISTTTAGRAAPRT